MKIKIIALLIIITSLLAVAGCVSTPTAPKKPEKLNAMAVKNEMKEKFPEFYVSRVVESEITGLYELHGKNNIIYTDGQYLFIGHVLSMDGQRDLTQEKIDQLPVEPIEVDAASALTVTDGNGSKEVVMITNPECPYCSIADEWFNDANTTRKILFLPLGVGADANTISEHILCAPDPAAEYRKVMSAMGEYFEERGGVNAVSFLKLKGFKLQTCNAGKSQLRAMQTAIDELGITGTPMFIVDGKLIEGADPKLIELIGR